MKSKTNKSIKLQSKTSDCFQPEKKLKQDPDARMNERQIHSFSMMLTKKRADDVREIVTRLAIGNRTIIQATHTLRRATGRLRLDAAPGSVQNKMAEAGQTLTSCVISTTTSSTNENPS